MDKKDSDWKMFDDDKGKQELEAKLKDD